MENENPYDAPSAPVDDVAPARREIVTAGRWRRLFNLLIDYVCVMLFGMVFGFVLGLALVFSGADAALDWLEQPSKARDYGMGIVVVFLYYVPMEAVFGFTVGKLVTGTRVVDESGLPPSWKQAIGRTLCRFIPFEAFSVLFSTDGKVRGWHDRLAGTYVVRTR